MEKIIYLSEIEEYDVMHNNVLGAHSLWEFVKFYSSYHSTKKNPDLLLLMPVLPIVFNKTSCELICRRNFNPGSLINTLIEDKGIFIGLQKRMEDMSDTTFNSLRIAFAANLLSINNNDFKIGSLSQANPSLQLPQDYNNIILASKRLGAWFAKYEISQITNYLNITF
ncbi:three component ABC system middle component [Cellulophaga sp. Z1A5H]|uniref:three component ABC system middle component n=1 Tax=Cellulophaga sp. Z1A5H TaxID=2687291 RepID=UPI0013FDBF7F|nr:three component ABC system middle component [Cellulophaga sp. Z1A5H]